MYEIAKIINNERMTGRCRHSFIHCLLCMLIFAGVLGVSLSSAIAGEYYHGRDQFSFVTKETWCADQDFQQYTFPDGSEKLYYLQACSMDYWYDICPDLDIGRKIGDLTIDSKIADFTSNCAYEHVCAGLGCWTNYHLYQWKVYRILTCKEISGDPCCDSKDECCPYGGSNGGGGGR
jgi:hypothetical protein